MCPKRNPFRVKQQQQVSPPPTQSIEPAAATPAAAATPTRITVTHSTRDGWIVTNVLLVYTISPSIVKSCFQMMQSEEVCQIKYWSLDDTITFDNANHQNMIFFVAVPSLLFYGVICPFLMMLYISLHTDRQTNPKLMFRFGLLYSGFAPKYWFYELILFLRKLLIILVVTFASSNKQQLHFALCVLIVLLCFLERLRPYNAEDASPKDRIVQTRLHQMEFVSLIILISMVWSAVFFVLGCKDDGGTCSVLGVVVLGSNIIFALGCGYTVAKAFQNKNQLGAKLEILASKFSFSLSRGSGPEGQTGEEADGEEEFRFVRSDGQEEIGCTISINPLAGGATRSEYVAGKKPVKDVQRQQVVSSGVGSGGGGSSGDSINTVTAAAAEIELMSMEKTEEEKVEIFVNEEGNSYFVNSKTGQTEWVK